MTSRTKRSFATLAPALGCLAIAATAGPVSAAYNCPESCGYLQGSGPVWPSGNNRCNIVSGNKFINQKDIGGPTDPGYFSAGGDSVQATLRCRSTLFGIKTIRRGYVGDNNHYHCCPAYPLIMDSCCGNNDACMEASSDSCACEGDCIN